MTALDILHQQYCNNIGFDISKKTRKREYVYARYIFFKDARNLKKKYSLEKIGMVCGNRNHATVINGLNMYEELKNYPDFKQIEKEITTMENKNEIQTTHSLDFETAPYSSPIAQKPDLKRFKVGTVIGIYGVTHDGYEIHSVNNTEIGNGHFNDVIQWFEYVCKRDKGTLTFTDVPTERFKKHLIEKRGFRPSEHNENDLVKSFDILLT